MAVASKTTLKTYFNTGDSPTQQQMFNLVDSMKIFDDESKVTAYHPNPGNGDTLPLLVADRAITITYFAVMSDSSTTFSCNLKKNTAGVLSNVTGAVTTVYDFTSASSFPTETITDSALASGAALYVNISSFTSGGELTFVVRYK